MINYIIRKLRQFSQKKDSLLKMLGRLYKNIINKLKIFKKIKILSVQDKK
jgi:CII-binding regulator of phage lambda lysogenization HflD